MKKLLMLAALLSCGVSFVGCSESAPPKPATPAPAVSKGTEAAPAKTDPAEGATPAGDDKPAADGAPAEEKKPE